MIEGKIKFICSRMGNQFAKGEIEFEESSLISAIVRMLSTGSRIEHEICAKLEELLFQPIMRPSPIEEKTKKEGESGRT